MFNILKVSFKIDTTSAVNSFINTITNAKLLKTYLKGVNLYKSKKFKRIITYLAFFCTSLRMIVGKVLYLSIIYGILKFLLKEVAGEVFLHSFFFLTIIGMFINNKILAVGKKKYYDIILLGMNAKKYTIAYYLYDMVTTFFLTWGSLTVCCSYLFKMNFILPLLLSILVILIKTMGEALDIYFYQRRGMLLINDMTLYFTIMLLGLIFAFIFPKLTIVFPIKIYSVLLFSFLPLAIFAFTYILKTEKYYAMYKQINTKNAIMNNGNSSAYNRQMAIEIRKKDYKINEKKLKGKTGYDYFNTIFFLRHKVILSSSAHIYAIVSFFLFLIAIIFVVVDINYRKQGLNLLTEHFSWIILIMYFVNRGMIVTQAMFYNCDRSMLTFNFYRDKTAIIKLFKKRVKTIIKINLLPALVIGVGLAILFSICTASFSLENIFIVIAIISLSIFFSIHHLALYYLLQPYDNEMKMKSVSFSLVSFLTYFICYLCKDIHLPFILFSLIIIILTIIYTIIILGLVYKKSPTTFKLK